MKIINFIKKTCLLRSLAAFMMIVPVSFLFSHRAHAQGDTGAAETTVNTAPGATVLFLLAMLIIVTILVFITAYYVLNIIKMVKAEGQPVAERKEEKTSTSFWSRLNKRFGAGEPVPVSREKEIMLDHEYDGIRELNNHMPPWLKYLFYATIAIAFVYMLHYMVLGTGKLQIEEYQEELAQAEAEAEVRKSVAGSSVDESNVALITDKAALEEANTLYDQNCAACHAKDGGGTVGPNLTDEYWLHGGSINDIFKTIKYGVQEKGMIPWQDKLKPEQIQNLASYIITLQGTTPANPKDPEGEKHAPEESVKTTASSI